MTSKFFLPARAAASTLCLLWLCGGPIGAHGQEAVAPTPSKARYGYVRFWNLLPAAAGRLDLVTATDATGKAFMSATPGSFQPGYRSVPPARYTWVVSRTSDRAKPLKTFTDIAVGPDVYVTVVARPSTEGGAEPILEVVNDTPDPKQPVENELRVFQCSPEIRAVVTASRTYKGEPLGYGGTQVLKELPNGIVPISINIISKGGSSIWNTEADFRMNPHATMVVLADVYGRIRPRVTVDGPTRSEIASAAESTNTAADSASPSR